MGRLSAANARLAEGFKEREAAEKPAPAKKAAKSALDGAAAKTKVASKADQAKELANKPDDALAERAKKAVAAAPQAGKEKAARVLPKGFKLPKTLALTADKLYETKTERLSYNKTIEELKNIEGAYADALIEKLPLGDASGVSGKVCRVSITEKQVPRVEDWPAFYKAIVDDYLSHVKKKTGQQDGAFSLLNRALNDGAVKERWENGKKVPGVGTFKAKSISVNKL
jgi:hypothetical protein